MKKDVKVLALDFGASSGRAIIGSFDGEKISLKEIHRFTNDPVILLDTMYWDVLRLFHDIKIGLIKAKQEGEIKSLGIDTWGVDFGLLNKDGKLLENPVHYRDARTKGMMEKVFAKLDKDTVYSITGNQFMELNTLFQLMALKENQPELLQKAETLLLMPDLLNYFLSNEKCTEYTIASTTQLLDAKNKTWSSEIIENLDLPKNIFTKIVQPGTKIGKLSKQISEELGINEIDVIAVAGHDTASAVAAVPALNRNFAYLSSGTWSLMGVETDAPVITEETERLNFTNEGGVAGTIRLLKNICGMWLLERCRTGWENISYPELIAEAEKAEPFRSLINPDDACFANPADMQEAICRYCAETNQPVPETRGQIVRCIFEQYQSLLPPAYLS